MRLPVEDKPGLETLELFAEATHFNQWLYENIAPFCSGNMLEIGSGIGNISRFLLQQKGPVTLSDVRMEYCNRLRMQFENLPNLKTILQIDLSLSDFENEYAQLLNQFDTIVALNVVEHIEDDRLVVDNCKKLLKPGGTVIILVPAYKMIYNSLDIALGHFRRYTSESLKQLLLSAGFNIVEMKYFNCAGILGWWFTGSIFKKQTIPHNQVRIYERLVPLFRWLDKLFMRRVGLSVIGVAKRT